MRFTEVLGATAFLASRAAATIYYAGVAESGGEFGVYSKTLIRRVKRIRLTLIRSNFYSGNWASRCFWQGLPVHQSSGY
jgi:hypothetical protein